LYNLVLPLSAQPRCSPRSTRAARPPLRRSSCTALHRRRERLPGQRGDPDGEKEALLVDTQFSFAPRLVANLLAAGAPPSTSPTALRSLLRNRGDSHRLSELCVGPGALTGS